VAALDDVEDRIACVGVEASRSEEGGTDIAGPERVTAAAVRSAEPLGLAECVDGEAASTLERAVVARARERLKKCEPVARRAVTDAVALPVAVGTRPSGQFGSGEKQVFIEVLPGAGEDTGSAGAPLETDPTISRPRELRPKR
jgi:hypothetical protein